MVAPSLQFVDLHDDKYRFDKYWDKMASVDVPMPETDIIDINDSSEPIPNVPVNKIIEFMLDNNYNQLFVRSGHKAAVDRFKEGSIIQSKNKGIIKKTVNSLFRQHIMNNIPIGDILVVRQLIDLDYCMKSNHSHSPEIRYFIEDGKIITRTPKKENFSVELECPMAYDFVKENIKDIKPPTQMVEKIAREFADSDYGWSVDFVLDNRGKWWATEMHINGVYYNENKQRWWNVCGHGESVEYSPRWMHSAALNEIR